MNKSKTIELLKKQIHFLQSKKDVIIYRGAIRSGKTYVGAIKTIINCMKGRIMLAIGPTWQMVVDNIVATIEEVAELMGIDIDVKTSKKRIYIGKGQVILRSAEKPERIRGFAAHDMWIDEASYIVDNKAYLRGYGRLSKSHDRQVFITSSPNGKDWVYKLSKNDNSELITQALADNYFLDEKFFKQLLEQYGGIDSPFAKQELFAEIVSFATGFFPVDRIVYSNDVTLTKVCVAFDLAFTKNKKSDHSAFAVCGLDNKGKFVVIDAQRWKFEAPITKKIIKEKILELGIDSLIEANGPQVAVFQDLVIDTDLQSETIIPVKPAVSKPARGISLAATMYNKNVIFINDVNNESKEWHEPAKEELEEFTTDDTHENDNILDCLTMCHNYLKTGDATGSYNAAA